MPYLDKLSWRRARTTWLAVACVIGFTSSAVYGQKDMGYGYCTLHRINYQGSNCPSCSSGSSGNSAPYTGPNIWQMLRNRKDQKAQKLRQDALNANQQGVELAKSGDWANAIVSYQRSLKLDPNDSIVLKNLAQAQTRLANASGEASYHKGDWANAVASFREALSRNPYGQNTHIYQSNLDIAMSALKGQQTQEQSNQQAEVQDKAAAANMQQAINSFAQSLNSAPTKAPSSGLEFGAPAGGNTAGKGGLDFMSGNSTETKQAVSPAKATLEFGDPMVVDARSVSADLPKDLFRDAVADTPKGQAAVGPMGAKDLDRLEQGLRKRLVETTDPRTRAWLEAQLGWTLNQRGDTAGAVQAIKRASELDPDSSMLKLLNTAANADTKEKYADAVFAAQVYLKNHPDNRVAAAVLAEADVKLRQAIATGAPDSVSTVPLVPFAQQNQNPPANLAGAPEDNKVRAEKEFGFQDFGKQSHQPHWQEPPPLDKRIQDNLDKNPNKYPELKQNQVKRAALVAEFKAADPSKAAEIKQQVEHMDQETEKKAQEILKTDFPTAAGL